MAVRLNNATTPLDRKGYLFGFPIMHSLSPTFHQTIFEALGLQWSQLFLESRDIAHFLELTKAPDFFGSAVTMPHKVAIMPYVDDLTPEARDVGACNTVYPRLRNGKRVLIGTNTDVVGVQRAFTENVSPSVYKGRPGLVIGGGGAARSAIYAMRKWLGVTRMYLVNRDVSEIEAIVRDCVKGGFGEELVHIKTLGQVEDEQFVTPGAIVACVPDIEPKTPEERTARAIVKCVLGKKERGAILEMCYHPSPWTAITALSEMAGWKVILGTEAMIWQGVEQSQLWTERTLPTEVIDRVRNLIADNLKQRRDHKL